MAAAAAFYEEPEVKVEYNNPFQRLLYMVTDIDKALKKCEGRSLGDAKLEQSDFIPEIVQRDDLLACFRSLPAITQQDYDSPDLGFSSRKPLPLEKLRKLLYLMAELRRVFTNEYMTPPPDAKVDMIANFLCIIGARYDLMSRVLYYLYSPHKGTFVPEEVPDNSTPADAKEIYPMECLAMSLVFGTKPTLTEGEYDIYLSAWHEARPYIKFRMYGHSENQETAAKIALILSRYKNLEPLLSQIPWSHITPENEPVTARRSTRILNTRKTP